MPRGIEPAPLKHTMADSPTGVTEILSDKTSY
jgi:hypothetical protein